MRLFTPPKRLLCITTPPPRWQAPVCAVVRLASKNGYQDSVLPSGDLAGAPEDALDTACGMAIAYSAAAPAVVRAGAAARPIRPTSRV